MPRCLPPLNRRRFLAASTAAGASLLLPRRLWAAEKVDKLVDPHLVVLISDIHLPGDRTLAWHNVRAVEAFEKVRERIFKLPCRPQGVLVCGDVARHHGEAADYATVAEAFKPFEENEIPVRMVMGNHDDREVFAQALPEQAKLAAEGTGELKKYVSIWETPQANWFLLDSLVRPNFSPGFLGEAQLKWLAEVLDARPGKPAFVVSHHHLALKKATEFVNSRALVDGEALLDILLPRKHVKAYVFGNCHQWNSGVVDGLPWVAIPSTAWGDPMTEPCGFVTCRLWKDGAVFELDCTDKNHPKHGTKFEIPWRS